MVSMAEGEQWKTLRAVMSPTFSTGKLKLVCMGVVPDVMNYYGKN